MLIKLLKNGYKKSIKFINLGYTKNLKVKMKIKICLTAWMLMLLINMNNILKI